MVFNEGTAGEDIELCRSVGFGAMGDGWAEMLRDLSRNCVVARVGILSGSGGGGDTISVGFNPRNSWGCNGGGGGIPAVDFNM